MIRKLTEKEKQLIEEDDIGCMDPRAMDWFTIAMGIAAIVVLFIIGGALALLYWFIRSII